MNKIEANNLLKYLRKEIKDIKLQIAFAKGTINQSPKKELRKYLQELELNLYKLNTAIKTGQIE